MIRQILFALVLIASLGWFASSARRLIRSIRIGREENRFDSPGARIRNVLVIAFGQSKLLREPLAGLVHFFIFWGFIILLTAVSEAIAEGLVPGFTLAVLGPLFPPVSFVQETIGLLVVVSCLVALSRWYVFPPRRYFGPEMTGHVRLDATLILILITAIVVSMFGTNATRMELAADPQPSRWLSVRLAGIFHGGTALSTWFELFWWLHILLVLGLLNYLPYSKHLHVLTAIPNVYFSSLRARGELSKLDLEDENAERFGAEDVRDLTWKQLLDGYACTDCGRCTASCPANATGKALSPRKIIMNIRERTAELSRVVLAGALDRNRETAAHRLLDNFITDEELWACTTCRACMEECPVTIEHVPAIVDMRRFLVLTESRFPAELTNTFKNLETNFNPWAFSPASRMDWAQGLGVRTMAEAGGEADILLWVGCAGAYDQRYVKVTRAVATLMIAAGVKFAVLGEEEKCNGDPARRAGNEYVAQMLVAENVETLNRYKVRRIVTACPHCFNALKNEYPQFGGNFEVIHHTQFLERLIGSGRLTLRADGRTRTTFHDSCYLGRYNALYDEPRALLTAAGADLVEMRRTRDRGFCCGAGGARMFMEETAGKRVNIERTEEALASRCQTIATACPFCLTMLTDGVKAREADGFVQVRDVAEILAERLLHQPVIK
ncbi:MAG: (Fe-S)-binding protein [Acidobacteria bacterium]|nr:(Fe-S)-binding protein [Acidobacteriota bacterium]